MNRQDDGDERQNMAGTGEPTDTGQTQEGSRSDLIGNLMKLRNAHGASSAVGQCCSNLIEALCVLPTYVRPAWAQDERQTLPWMIQQEANRLAALTAGAN